MQAEEEGLVAALDILESHGAAPTADNERGRGRVLAPLPSRPDTLAGLGGKAAAVEAAAVRVT